MINIFAKPDKEKNYQSYMIYVLVMIWIVVTLVVFILGLYRFPDLWRRWVTFLCCTAVIVVFNLYLNSLGHTRIACWSLTFMLWLYITIPCYSAGGIASPAILSQASVIFTAGFLLGWRGGLVFGLLSIIADFGLAYLEISGHLPLPTVVHDAFSRWIGTIIPFGTILLLQYFNTNHLRDGLSALQREIEKRKEAENITGHTVYDLAKRVKELKTLSSVSRILQLDGVSDDLFQQVTDTLVFGWQFPAITAAHICIADAEFFTSNFKPSEFSQKAEMKTTKDTKVSVEVVYLEPMPESDEGPFLQEERNLINMVTEMLKIHLERRERRTELKDYKYALDIASCVSISELDGTFSYVNDNFCKISKYKAEELLGQPEDIISSKYHWPEFFMELKLSLQDGKPYRGEFCNKAKDDSLYWVDTSVIPLLDEKGKVYQFLSISYDITERKQAEVKLKQNEQLIKKITSQVPGNTYLFEIKETGNLKIIFSNKGTDIFNYSHTPEDLIKDPEKIVEIIYEDDLPGFRTVMKQAYITEEPISFQYRIVANETIRWRWLQAICEKDRSGKILWYGATSDITPLIDYIVSNEQMIFDIGHVIRRPISSMKGMTRLINEIDLDENEVREMSEKLYLISEEMDKFIGELNTAYYKKRQETKLNIDVSSLIDKRGSLFKEDN